MNRCDSCGRVNEEDSMFCAACGRPMVRGSARVVPAPPIARPSSVRTGRGSVMRSVSRPTSARAKGPQLSLLDEAGEVQERFIVDGGSRTFGRSEGDIRFPDDVFLSPLHAQVTVRDGALFLRDLGSRNGTWVFITEPYRLQDGDTILVGSQLLRFRRLGYPAPHPPEADQTRRLGSLAPNADVAVLAQLRADGSARDVLHLSPGRRVRIGRGEGDWIFPYDETMSGSHAELRSEDLDFILLDDGSRNGVAVAVRGERPLSAGQRFLVGDLILRLDSL